MKLQRITDKTRDSIEVLKEKINQSRVEHQGLEPLSVPKIIELAVDNLLKAHNNEGEMFSGIDILNLSELERQVLRCGMYSYSVAKFEEMVEMADVFEIRESTASRAKDIVDIGRCFAYGKGSRGTIERDSVRSLISIWEDVMPSYELIGTEVKVGKGRCDILCKEKFSGKVVIIECKSGESSAAADNQLRGYIERYSNDIKQDVGGMIIAERNNDKHSSEFDFLSWSELGIHDGIYIVPKFEFCHSDMYKESVELNRRPRVLASGGAAYHVDVISRFKLKYM